jgi:hypothetical protein
MPDRTKDGPKARNDVKLLGIKKDLHFLDSDDDDDDQKEGTQG